MGLDGVFKFTMAYVAYIYVMRHEIVMPYVAICSQTGYLQSCVK